MRYAFIAFLLISTNLNAQQHFPDGTLISSNKPGTLVGNIARRQTSGEHYTHIAIVIDGLAYEKDFGVKTPKPASQYGKPRTVNDYYIPIAPIPKHQIDVMRIVMKDNMRQPYQLRDFFRRSNKQTTNGDWCSTAVGKAFKAAGYNIDQYNEGFTPQRLLNSVNHNYKLHTRIRR